MVLQRKNLAILLYGVHTQGAGVAIGPACIFGGGMSIAEKGCGTDGKEHTNAF